MLPVAPRRQRMRQPPRLASAASAGRLSSAVGGISSSGGQTHRTPAEDFTGTQTPTSGEAVGQCIFLVGGPDPFLGIELAERVTLPLHRGEELVDEHAVGAAAERGHEDSRAPSPKRQPRPPQMQRQPRSESRRWHDADRNSLGDVFPNSWAASPQCVRRDPFRRCEVLGRQDRRGCLGDVAAGNPGFELGGGLMDGDHVVCSAAGGLGKVDVFARRRPVDASGRDPSSSIGL
jgi:hypothetical protein